MEALVAHYFELRPVISSNVAIRHKYKQGSLGSLLLSLETPNDVCLVAKHTLNLQATSKGSDRIARMGRLV